MRETRDAQASIFDFYAQHEFGTRLSQLSAELDQHPEILDAVGADIQNFKSSACGARGLSIESILRALLLKTLLQVSYRHLAFQLSDSPSCRAFVRLRGARDAAVDPRTSVVKLDRSWIVVDRVIAHRQHGG